MSIKCFVKTITIRKFNNTINKYFYCFIVASLARNHNVIVQNYSYNSVNLCETATLKNTKNDFQDLLSLNAGQTYCRMFQKEHSAILATFMKLPVVIRHLFCLFLSGRFSQVLLYTNVLVVTCYYSGKQHCGHTRLVQSF